MTEIFFKVLLVGDASVGKTCLMSRFILNRFEEGYISTIGVNYYTKEYDYKGYKIKLQLWDTAGQERFHSITSNYFRGADGIFFIYDITNINSFEGVKNWIKESEDYDNNIEKILLGNKCDLDNSRDVRKEEVEIFSKEKKMDFYETSAKENINLDEAFKRMIELIFNTKETQNLLRNREYNKMLIANNTGKNNNNSTCC
jgi:small GTP-binding protein